MLVLAAAVAGRAQNDVMTAILQHGDEAKAFIGTNAFIEAHEAAVDGDVIALSQGTFTSTAITKSISVYGAGYEKDEAVGTAVTMLNGHVHIGKADATVKNVRLEGVYVNGNIYPAATPDNSTTALIEDVQIVKCYVTGEIQFWSNATNVVIQQCVLKNSVMGHDANVVVKSLQVSNCYVGYNVRNFHTSSTVQVDHCFLASRVLNDGTSAFLLTNSIFWHDYYGVAGTGSTMYNCMVTYINRLNFNGIYENCYVVGTGDIFADESSANYSPTRTFELKQPDEWVGNDGTEIGIRGGQGFSKVPGTPAVKNLKVDVEGKQLKVNYEAVVR